MKVFLIFFTVLFLNGLSSAAPAEVTTISELGTGRHTRAVWSEGTTMSSLKMWAMESKDGSDISVRDLGVTGNGILCYLTPDGQKIVYAIGTSSNEKDTYIMDWDGSNNKLLKAKASLVDIWEDPVDGRAWAYYTRYTGNNQKPMKRFPIDNPTEEVTVLSNVGVGYNYFGTSWDEKWGFAATPTWGTTALVNMESDKIEEIYGVGCETTVLGPLADGSYYLLETGQFKHESLVIYKVGDKTGVELPSPTVGKGDHAFGFSRWATTKTDPRYIIARSPDNFNLVASNHLLMLRVNSAYTEIEAWMQISPDDHSPFASSVWMAEGSTVIFKFSQIGSVSENLPYRFLSPAPGYMGVEIKVGGNHSVSLFGINGKRFDYHGGVGKTVYHFNGNRKAAGLYIVRVNAGGKTFSERFLVPGK